MKNKTNRINLNLVLFQFLYWANLFFRKKEKNFFKAMSKNAMDTVIIIIIDRSIDPIQFQSDLSVGVFLSLLHYCCYVG